MHSSALGRLTLRSAMAVNGGAALALVALIGWLAVSEFFAWPIVPLATALAALAQAFSAQPWPAESPT